MKKLISLILLVSNISFGACDWSTIKTLPDGGYEYSPALNLCVGNLVASSKAKDQAIADLQSAIQLKDLALTAADNRTALWEKTSDSELDRLNTISNDQKKSDWIAFSLGALLVLGSGFMAARLINK